MTESAAIADDRFFEVVDGQVVEKPPMGANEALIATVLAARLYQHASGRRIGWPIHGGLFLLDPVRPLKRRPDVAFISHERWPRHKPRPAGEAWEVVPDLAVEVPRKSTKAVDIITRIDEYFQTGVRLVWVIYPRQTVYVYTLPTELQILRSGDDLAGGAVIPGFRMPVKTLFEDED